MQIQNKDCHIVISFLHSWNIFTLISSKHIKNSNQISDIKMQNLTFFLHLSPNLMFFRSGEFLYRLVVMESGEFFVNKQQTKKISEKMGKKK